MKVIIQINHYSIISRYQSWSVGGDKNRALTTVSTIISSSLGGQGANQVVTQAVSPYTAYAIGQYLRNCYAPKTPSPLPTYSLHNHPCLW